jgi:DegV family protein with EDD domain
MAKIAFVTDSTAYLPDALVREYKISVAPLLLLWDSISYRDGVDIQPSEFYTRLKTAKTMPTTSQVPVIVMKEIFQDLVDKGSEVLGTFISSKLSGTMQSAQQALQEMGTAAEKVTIVDSYATAMALGFQVLAAARAVRDGATVKDCKELIERSRSQVGVYFSVDTLEFLHRGGRIGSAQRFIGSALNMKPILALKNGQIEAEDRVRTKAKALDRVLELVKADVSGKPNIHLSTVHANAEEEARQLLDRASQELGAVESVLAAVSPVIGTHAGPGTVGLVYMAGI